MKLFLITLLASLSFGYAAHSPKAKSAQLPPKQEQKQEKSYWEE